MHNKVSCFAESHVQPSQLRPWTFLQWETLLLKEKSAKCSKKLVISLNLTRLSAVSKQIKLKSQLDLLKPVLSLNSSLQKDKLSKLENPFSLLTLKEKNQLKHLLLPRLMPRREKLVNPLLQLLLQLLLLLLQLVQLLNPLLLHSPARKKHPSLQLKWKSNGERRTELRRESLWAEWDNVLLRD